MNTFKDSETAKALTDEKTVVDDFMIPIPFGTYRPMDYPDYQPLFSMKEERDGYLEKLFEGVIDEGNGDVLDALIIDRAEQALTDLKKRRAEHEDTIHEFYLRAESDRAGFQDQLEKVSRELDRNKIELTILEKRFMESEYGKETENEER